MPWPIIADAVVPTQSVTPYEVEHEIDALLRSVNGGVDRDVLDSGQLTTTHLAQGAAHAVVVVNAASTTLTKSASTVSADWAPIDGAAASIDCIDGILEVEANVDLDMTPGSVGGPLFVALGVFVDEQLVAATDPENISMSAPSSYGQGRITLDVSTSVPVGTGSRYVRVALAIVDSAVAAAATINITETHLWLRNARR